MIFYSFICYVILIQFNNGIPRTTHSDQNGGVLFSGNPAEYEGNNLLARDDSRSLLYVRDLQSKNDIPDTTYNESDESDIVVPESETDELPDDKENDQNEAGIMNKDSKPVGIKEGENDSVTGKNLELNESKERLNTLDISPEEKAKVDESDAEELDNDLNDDNENDLLEIGEDFHEYSDEAELRENETPLLDDQGTHTEGTDDTPQDKTDKEVSIENEPLNKNSVDVKPSDKEQVIENATITNENQPSKKTEDDVGLLPDKETINISTPVIDENKKRPEEKPMTVPQKTNKVDSNKKTEEELEASDESKMQTDEPENKESDENENQEAEDVSEAENDSLILPGQNKYHFKIPNNFLQNISFIVRALPNIAPNKKNLVWAIETVLVFLSQELRLFRMPSSVTQISRHHLNHFRPVHKDDTVATLVRSGTKYEVHIPSDFLINVSAIVASMSRMPCDDELRFALQKMVKFLSQDLQMFKEPPMTKCVQRQMVYIQPEKPRRNRFRFTA